MAEKHYYIYSSKWTNGIVRTFWRPNGEGYTIDLGRAGLFTASYRPVDIPIAWSRDHLNRLISEKPFPGSYKIPEEKIEQILGEKITCVKN